ncbi:MAG: hypothetical protein C0173_10130 [Desulfurella sp.]|uniref:hypothetical protein n=1 Tax=Desulfurella sp. TaxID=1962857 RepID=UPI000CCB8AAF|nr:hypothetical protein [Desulfurella sp.]PMP87096.1 MAG: hypothetical protein C0173_10130 [Desulfurella sp.]
MNDVTKMLKKDLKKILPMVARNTKNNYDPLCKWVYLNFNRGEIVATGFNRWALAVIKAPYLQGMYQENCIIYREDAVELLKMPRIQINDIIKNKLDERYPQYDALIGKREYSFTFNKQEFLEKLLKITQNHRDGKETFEIIADSSNITITGVGGTQTIKYERLHLPLNSKTFKFYNKIILTALKMVEDKEVDFVFNETRIIEMVSDSLKFTTVTIEQ